MPGPTLRLENPRLTGSCGFGGSRDFGTISFSTDRSKAALKSCTCCMPHGISGMFWGMSLHRKRMTMTPPEVGPCGSESPT